MIRRLKQILAQRALAADVERRRKLVGAEYERRRNAALKATRPMDASA